MLRKRLYKLGWFVALTLICAGMYSNLDAQVWGDGMYHNGMQYMMWGGQLPKITASGKTIDDSLSMAGMMDTARSQLRYFVDSSGNGIRKYELFFGPYWYHPASGAERPSNGESIIVRGGLFAGAIPPVLVVYQLNGMAWRDSTGAPPWGGSWVHRSTTDSTRIFCSADSLTWVTIPPGGMGTGVMGGGMMMWPDSMFMEFDEMMPDSLPHMHDSAAVMGFHMNAFAPTGISMMQGGMMGGQGMMTMGKSMLVRIYVHPDTLLHHGLTLGRVKLMFLDADSVWKDVPSQMRDLQASAIITSQSNVSPYLALTVTNASSVDEEGSGTPMAFALEQNYPNPFNPTTTIMYALPEHSHVVLTVFNTLGQQVSELINSEIEAGYHEIVFDARNLASGVYFYKLIAGSYIQTKKLILIR